jgi:probable F420-dependent oxidoreductase
LPISFGVRLPVSGPLASIDNIKLAARESEALGFDTLWVHDQIIWSKEQNSHHVSSGSAEAVVDRNPDFFECITTLSYLAGITSSSKLGVAIIVLPYRNPLVLAKQLMNLDVVSSGRLIIGVGAGAPIVADSFNAIGVSFEKRGEITDDYLKALLAIFENQPRSSYTGNYAKFENIEMFPKAIQRPHPPIVVGGLGRALKRAALYGDGWIPTNITPSALAEGVSEIRETAMKAGRTASEFIIGNEIFASIDRDSGVARRKATATIASYAKSIGRGSEDVTLIGSPSEIIARVEDYAKAGVNTFELKFIYNDMRAFTSQLKLFAKDVVASFK